MASGLQVGEQVFVPVSLLEDIGDRPSAFHRTPVLEVGGRSVRVEVGGNSHWVANSKCQRNIGLLIFGIGDLETEVTLLDPLSKSVLQFCRLLASDDYVRFYKIRSTAELAAIWAREHAAYSHVMIIGHGNGAALNFAVNGWRNAEQLSAVLDLQGVDPKIFVSRACQAGQAAFGRPFSQWTRAGPLSAPFIASTARLHLSSCSRSWSSTCSRARPPRSRSATRAIGFRAARAFGCGGAAS